ncbi:hypothetical protein SCP_1403420 [Sparassis crispa]|uniref:Uncharacterized protein n=1 Tax=Sparassis crispa TaxID=139825 RepID=A0A401H3E6_9APHY|nr:hypothetical protein SCP_1403420 [Sparassis crispa]GBE88934.1 hypothetical protein SCP_1403420 [Sparassis crispa]
MVDFAAAQMKRGEIGASGEQLSVYWKRKVAQSQTQSVHLREESECGRFAVPPPRASRPIPDTQRGDPSSNRKIRRRIPSWLRS